jgi:hemerythrin-like domain-containing protein
VRGFIFCGSLQKRGVQGKKVRRLANFPAGFEISQKRTKASFYTHSTFFKPAFSVSLTQQSVLTKTELPFCSYKNQGATVLTATYSLVAITTEQDNTRSMLARLQHCIRTTWNGFQGIDFNFLQTTFDRLTRFDRYFRHRKLELYLIPALRSMSREAEALIADLEALSDKAMNIVRSIADQLSAAFDLNVVAINRICNAMERYCDHLSARIEREEKELIPLARRLLSIEDWFVIAAQLLHDDGMDGRRRRTYPDNGTTNVSVNSPAP